MASPLPVVEDANLSSDEHYRRSSDCSFFVFAQPPTKKGKGSRSKKARTSKASSRLSTQSVATVASEAPEMDVDESMDQSIMSQATVKPKATKKGAKGKGKGAKSRKEEVELESQMDVDEADLAQPVPPKPKRAGRGRKRVSEETNDDPESVLPEESQQSLPPAEPPMKRRATRTRSSSVSQAYSYEPQDHVMADAASVDKASQEEEPKKGRKTSKKGAASKSRKASDVSVASKATSKARMPRDSELEAALEAGLEAGLEADGPEVKEQEPEPEMPRPSKKTKPGKKSKAVAKSPEPLPEPVEHADVHEEQLGVPVDPSAADAKDPEGPAPKSKTTKSSKKKGSKKTKKEESTKAETSVTQESSDLKSTAGDRAEDEHHESFVSVEIINRESEPRASPQLEPAEKTAAKKASKKDDKAKKSKKTKKAEQTPESVPEQRDFRSPSRDDDVFGTPDDIPDQVEMVAGPQASSLELEQPHEKTPIPPKTTKRFSDIPHDDQLAKSFTESQGSGGDGRRDHQKTSRSSNRVVSPLPAAHQSTPSLSPQSSDAENRPPSSRPSTSRLSASKGQRIRTPLAVSTPSPSKRNANAGFPPSAHPWTPVDIDEALYGEASDKENADLTGIFQGVNGNLTSPEKKMTVEEWIMWNAKNGEERLKRECERLVGQFEKEGGRAMQRLEAIECMN